MGDGSKSKYIDIKTGERRKKGRPRGISALRAKDPTIPNPLQPYFWKKGQPGNPGGRSKKQRISDAVTQELGVVDETTKMTRAEIVAANLVTRAERDSSEVDRILRITEPSLNPSSSGFGLSVTTPDMSLILGKIFNGNEPAPAAEVSDRNPIDVIDRLEGKQ